MSSQNPFTADEKPNTIDGSGIELTVSKVFTEEASGVVVENEKTEEPTFEITAHDAYLNKYHEDCAL